MSKQLLLDLNGNKRGDLYNWIKNHPEEPRIAWYPSAGEDLRDLLYLHPKFAELNQECVKDPEPPNIFLHTDYFPWSTSQFLDHFSVHYDDMTSISVQSIEELPRCDLPLDQRIVHFPDGSNATGRAIFTVLSINSNKLGVFEQPLIYVFAENSAFCAQKILPNMGKISHVIKHRSGGGHSGGNASGEWLLNVLAKIECECFITDNHYFHGAEETIYELYPELSKSQEQVQLSKIREMMWAGEFRPNQLVTWNRVENLISS